MMSHSIQPCFLKKTFSIQSTHKEQSSHSVAHKGQFSIQFTHKKQFSHSVAHKGQSSTQSACQKQPSYLIVHQKQSTLTQAEQFSNSVILKKSFNISATSEKPLSFISSTMELKTPNYIAQTI